MGIHFTNCGEGEGWGASKFLLKFTFKPFLTHGCDWLEVPGIDESFLSVKQFSMLISIFSVFILFLNNALPQQSIKGQMCDPSQPCRAPQELVVF
jgi:hypothetical protein